MNTGLPSPLPFPARGARGGDGRRKREKQEACQRENDAENMITTYLNKIIFFLLTEGAAGIIPPSGRTMGGKIYRMVEKKRENGRKTGV